MNGARILIIYTGGTIGMLENPTTGALEAFDWEHISNFVPELARFHYDIETITFGPPIDSSDMEPKYWTRMVEVIADNYDNYDGFVLLHGTDTMAFTASALSFMLENLGKPVVITGSQLPIGQLRTDGKENLLTSIEIAAARCPEGKPMVPEVCIFFENKLLRGNRTTKINSEGFNAFRSYNFHHLADAGIHIKFEEAFIHRPDPAKPFRPNYLLDDHIAILTLFPGMREEVMNAYLDIPNLRGLVLKTYGAGNAPKLPWLYERLKTLSELPDPVGQVAAVRAVLADIPGALDVPELIVLNKIDLTDAVTRAALRTRLPGAIEISARTGEGIEDLRARIDAMLPRPSVPVDVVVPYSRGDLVSRVHTDGEIDVVEYVETGTRIVGRADAALAAELRTAALPDAAADSAPSSP